MHTLVILVMVSSQIESQRGHSSVSRSMLWPVSSEKSAFCVREVDLNLS